MMVDAIKQVVINYLNYAKLADVLFGNVINMNPVTIKLDNNSSNFNISEPFLVITDRFKKEPLSVGDKVVLVRAHGGQMFVILDKV